MQLRAKKPAILAASALATFGMIAATPAAGANAAPITAVQQASASTVSVVPAAKKKNKKVKVATVATGPSKWRGKRLRHPSGRKFPAQVIQWANLAKAVMFEHGVKRKYLKGVLAQIQQESSGNPNAVNNWDSNARRGTPSKGLLQVIAPTYRYYAKKGHRNTRYQTVPYTNLWAAMNYVKSRYGMGKFRSWNRGYNQGY
ncbi:MAG: transglycosylase SLT domain-containing protein [Actinomycetia bacterium]|nr:transglycosylase SLT domain-containing protein [Actinomycetes bacterium]